MITIGNFKDINDTYDEVWFIVRSLKNGLPKPLTETQQYYHVPQLSPSWDLFKDYYSWANAGIWNKDCFMERYVPRFLKQMKEEESKQFLNALYFKAKTKNILLVCFCQNEELCHRSIVFGLLQGVGAETNGNDYRHYYDLYKYLLS